MNPLFVLLALSAQLEGPLLLEDVHQSVEAFHPKIAGAEQGLRKAEADLLAAEGGFDTQLKSRAGQVWGNYPTSRLDAWVEQPTPLWGASFFGGYRLGLGDFATYDGKLATRDWGELRAGIALPVWKDGPIDRRRANIAQAEVGTTQAGRAVDLRRLDLLREASFLYWEWVAAGERLGIAQALLAIAEERNRQLIERAKRGDVPDVERTDNLRTVFDRRAKVVSARRKLEQAAIKLSLYLRGTSGDPLIAEEEQLPGGLPPPDDGARPVPALLFDAALARRPELDVLKAERQRAKVETDLAWNQVAPSVDILLGVSQDLGPGSESLGKTDFEVGVLFDLPLLLRSARGKAEAAEATTRKIDADLRYAEDTVKAQVRDALSALEAARERVLLAQQQVETANVVEEAEKRRFELGDATILQVNLREQATADARLSEVDARLEHALALANLQAATAELIER